jgi:hypothetical protein
VSDGDPGNSKRQPLDGMDFARRQRCGADLLARASAVLREGWSDYRNVWSMGEVLGVALTLGDLKEIDSQGETENSALNRWAFDLWGLTVGEIEEGSNCPRTRKFFDSLAVELAGEDYRPSVISEADVEDHAQRVYGANREAGY